MDTTDRHLNSQRCTVITSNLRWLYVGSNISPVEDLIQDGEYKRWPKTQRSSQRKLKDNSKIGNAVDLGSFLRYWTFLCTWRNSAVCLWKSHVWYAYHLLYVDIPCTSQQYVSRLLDHKEGGFCCWKWSGIRGHVRMFEIVYMNWICWESWKQYPIIQRRNFLEFPAGKNLFNTL